MASGIDAGLHRPVLRPRQMMVVEGVPHDDALIVERAVGSGPARQAIAAGMLVGVAAGGVELVGGIAGGPEMPEHESRPPRDGRFRVQEGQGIGTGNEAVADGLAQGIAHRGVGDTPIARGGNVDQALGLCLGDERRLDDPHGIAVGIVAAHRSPGKIDLGHGIALAVDSHLKAEGEHVLMDMGIDPRRHQGAVARRLAEPSSRDQRDAGR